MDPTYERLNEMCACGHARRLHMEFEHECQWGAFRGCTCREFISLATAARYAALATLPYMSKIREWPWSALPGMLASQLVELVDLVCLLEDEWLMAERNEHKRSTENG